MTTTDLGPTPAAPTDRRLLRRSDDKVFGGVAAAIARHLDIDPVIVRVTLIVLTVFGGSGVVLYLAGWLMIPDETGRSIVSGWAPRGRALGRLVPIVALVVAGIVVLGLTSQHATRSGGLLALLAVAGFLLLRERSGPPGATPAMPSTPGQPVTSAVPAPARRGGSVRVRMRRPASPIGPLTLLAAAVVGALVALFGGTAVAALATALGIVLAGLVAGILVRRARWLAAPALLLAALLGAAAIARGVPLGDGNGTRVWTPASVAELQPQYRLGAGDMTLDLRTLPSTGGTVRASLGAGRLVVRLAPDAAVTVRAHAGLGEADVLGRENDGLDVDVRSAAGSGGQPLVLDLSVGYGLVRVLR